MLIPTKNEPAFLLPILTLLELEMKVAKLERSLIQFDVFKWLYDKWIQGMQVFCVNFCNIFPVMQFDVVLLIIFNCEIVSVNLGVDFVPFNCLKKQCAPIIFLLFILSCRAVLMSREAFSSDAKLRQHFISCLLKVELFAVSCSINLLSKSDSFVVNRMGNQPVTFLQQPVQKKLGNFQKEVDGIYIWCHVLGETHLMECSWWCHWEQCCQPGRLNEQWMDWYETYVKGSELWVKNCMGQQGQWPLLHIVHPTDGTSSTTLFTVFGDLDCIEYKRQINVFLHLWIFISTIFVSWLCNTLSSFMLT